MVGGWVADGFRSAIGSAAYVAPAAFVALGALMVTRSALVDVRPFRTGLPVAVFGLMLTLGSSHGGGVGQGLDALVSKLLGSTGSTILGDTETAPYMVKPSVMECATVNAVTCASTSRARLVSRNIPSTKRM